MPISDLARIAETQFGEMVKAVADVRRGILSLGAELHADDEAALLEDGSRQEDLWGINLYPAESSAEWIEFDSLINVRPSQGNRSRDIENPEVREQIRRIVEGLIVR
jgi:hypothetical protein